MNSNKFKSHTHTWHSIERAIPGGVMKLHVCLDHHDGDKVKPVVKAYDMEVIDHSRLQGSFEYESKSRKT